MKKTWKPTTAGILSIVGGSVGILGALTVGALGAWGLMGMDGMWGTWGSGGHMLPWGANLLGSFGLVALILGAIAIVGGIFALQRKHWGLSLAGAICATLVPMSFVLGILAIVFIAISHDEFGG